MGSILRGFSTLVLCISPLFAQFDGDFSGLNLEYLNETFQTKHGAGPVVVDWDGDGNKDLIVGFHYAGWLYFYRNSGTDMQPQFNSVRRELKADGIQIAFEFM